jgi:hypothetical protein
VAHRDLHTENIFIGAFNLAEKYKILISVLVRTGAIYGRRFVHRGALFKVTFPL